MCSPDDMEASLEQTLQQCDALRRASRWQEARAGYESALPRLQNDAVLAHNLALCHLALGEHRAAITQSARALELNDGLWQSAIVRAKALSALGLHHESIALLTPLIGKTSSPAALALELGRLLMQHGGDAAGAVALARPWIGSEQDRDAHMLVLLAQLYDRDLAVTPDALSTALCGFSQANLQLAPPTGVTGPGADMTPEGTPAAVPAVTPGDAPARTRSGLQVHSANLATPGRTRPTRRAARPRVGLLSPQFTVSPVYFFTIGALRLLAEDVDLVFFSRGTKTDWGTQAFQAIANDWIDTSDATAGPLATTLAEHRLDVAIDLGGWMDPVGLSALSARPARRQYKWVGGQSATTGLRCFDGYLTDRYQTPRGSDRLFSEPLIRLDAGYVTYTPPPYLPAPSQGSDCARLSLGVVANPAKVSRAFLDDLGGRLPRWQAQARQAGCALQLQFIDQRYRQPAIRTRIEAALRTQDVAIEFLAPEGHRGFLSAVGRLDAIVDTWPYSGGLTTIEALAMGVPVYTRAAGALFCERHTLAHCRYAGLKLSEFDLDRFTGLPRRTAKGQSLIGARSARSSHDALAQELLTYLRD